VKECGPPAVTAPLTLPASSLERCGHGAMLALEYVVVKSVFINCWSPALEEIEPCEQSYTDTDARSAQGYSQRGASSHQPPTQERPRLVSV
jgi:hypothetical protein